jgi:orotidine-5'-phosphate decarboxylase
MSRHSHAGHLCVALDVDTLSEATALATALVGKAGVLKIGLELFCGHGPSAVLAVAAAAPGTALFLDLKLHDIPHTVQRAVAQVRRLGVAWLTIHAAGGNAMMRAAVEAAAEDVNIIAVTMLTALSNEDVAAVGFAQDAGNSALQLAALARDAGVGALVCSPLEISKLRPLGLTMVTPGIRASHAGDDQQRTATAAQAFAAGSDLLVVGRPITRAVDPVLAADSLLAELKAAGPPRR